MNRRSILPAVMLTCLNGYAQQVTAGYDFTTVAQPGTKIGDFTFTDDTVIENIALNEQGDAAFIASWAYDQTGAIMRAVFTPHRMIAREGDIIEDRYIDAIVSLDLSINEVGHVAYQSVFTEDSPGSRIQSGVFVDEHFALTTERHPLVRTDKDGGYAPSTLTTQDSYQRQQLPYLVVNRRGDLLILLRLNRGFVLLLGTRRGH